MTSFYEQLLPALGFTRQMPIPGWLQYEAADEEMTAFFGITESPGHVPNDNRIAFWAENKVEVDRIGELVKRIGAKSVEGPMDYSLGYYALFFDDPDGNRLEVCHRWKE